MNRFFSSFPIIVALPAFFLMCFLLSPPLVSAQTSDFSLITSPLPISIVAEPGTSVSTDIKVKNGGLKEESLKINLMKFRAYEDTGKPELLDPEPKDDFLNWVSFSEPSFSLGPNEWKTVTATFRVPKEASFGYYYAIVFSRADGDTVSPGKTAIVGGTAVLVLLEARVKDAVRSVEVAEFSVDRRFYEFLPATFHITLKNNGNVHLSPRGNIFIDRGDIKNITAIEVNDEKGNILPGSSRIFEAKWEDGFPLYEDRIEDDRAVLDEEGNKKQTLVWNWKDASKLRMGKYTATLLLIYDDGTRDIPIEGTVSFFVVPWRLLGAVGIIIVFFFIGLRSTVVKMWKKAFGKKMEV